ncbi:MAG: sugar phosphate isomerase/epimerase [Fimbriimonadaceae bacterium]|nr:sugar phosphate isomerase/epimerase [Fimbriimonadaceae bacterium]
MRIAAQLYTLRDFTKTKADFEQTLERVAEMGYAGVQFSAVGCMAGDSPEVSAVEAKAMLDRLGLVCCATHRAWESLRDNLEAELRFHADLDCGFTAIGSAPEEYRNVGAPGFQRLGEEMAELNRRSGGLQIAYHNHALEFQKTDGVHWFWTLAAAGGADLPMEIDTYWVALAGIDVASVLRRLKGRVPMIHVKDLIPHDWTVTYAPVGEGNLDWDSILPAARESGTEWLIVELDTCLRDPFDCMDAAHRNLQAMVG